LPVKLLQITDCHLGEQKGERLLGLDTDESLELVLAHMWEEQQQVDLIVCSGDLSNEAGAGAYERLIEKLPSDIPQAWLPGNHDENECMQTFVADNRRFLPTLNYPYWQITLLDSSIPNAVPGLIEFKELERAINVLEQFPEKSHVIFMHHPLQMVGCKWLDTQVIGNADAVLSQLEKYPQLKLIVCGHVHQETHNTHKHIQLYSTPSTCIQFKKHSDGFAVGDEMPGYRWIELHDDGTFATAVSRIPFRELHIDHGSSGY
jgi:Icc protein